jgi:hypothetical protein
MFRKNKVAYKGLWLIIESYHHTKETIQKILQEDDRPDSSKEAEVVTFASFKFRGAWHH